MCVCVFVCVCVCLCMSELLCTFIYVCVCGCVCINLCTHVSHLGGIIVVSTTPSHDGELKVIKHHTSHITQNTPHITNHAIIITHYILHQITHITIQHTLSEDFRIRKLCPKLLVFT